MRKQTSFVTLASLLVMVAMAGVMSFCSEKKSVQADKPEPMVVVFASGDVKVVQSSKEIDAKVGLIVQQNDQIKTGNGTLDLQTKSGSAIRVREFTTISVSQLTGGKTKLSMNSGSILATVKKESAKEEFEVVTPTAIAGVRGTTFAVEVSDGREPRVKVLDGKVSMAPRVAALDNYTKEEIEADPALKKISDVAASHEVVIEESQEATIDPVVEEMVLATDKGIEKAISEKKEISKTVKVDEMESGMKKAKDQKAIHLADVQITAQEKSEKDTLVIVDKKILEQVIESNKSNNNADAAIVKELVSQRTSKQEVVLKKIEDEASKTTFKSEEEIKKHYEKLEMIVLKDGKELKGAVIAQTGTLLVIHTPDGVQRIDKGEVASQEFLY